MENSSLNESFRNLKQIQAKGLTGQPPDCALAYEHYLLLFGSDASKNGDCTIFDTKNETMINASTRLYLRKTLYLSLCHWKENVFVLYDLYIFGGYELILLYLTKNGPETTFEIERLTQNHQEYPRTSLPIHIYKDGIYVIARGDETVEFWRYDLTERNWKKCEVTGDIPKDRHHSASVLFEDKIYLFGGVTKGGFARTLNDLSVLDIEKMKWETIHKDNFLPADTLTDLKAEVVGQDIYIGSANFQELFIYSPATNSVQKIEASLPKGDFMIKSHQNNATLFRIGLNDHNEPFIEYQRLGIESDQVETVKAEAFLSQASHMELLWKEKPFPDVTFVVRDEEILAHRNILLRCRYFQNMFKSGMKEANESKIHVPAEISATNFKAILEYIYLEKVVLTESLALDLIMLADMYFLTKLKADCEDYLLKNLKTENFLNVVDAAEKADSEKLKKGIVSFFVENAEKVREEVDLEKIPSELFMQMILYMKQSKK